MGAGRKQGHRRDSNPDPAVLGVPPPEPFAFSCSFSHRLKGEKQNLDAAMSRVQEKKHLRRLRASLPPRPTPAYPDTPFQGAAGDTRPLSFMATCRVSCCAGCTSQLQEPMRSDGQLNHKLWSCLRQ